MQITVGSRLQTRTTLSVRSIMGNTRELLLLPLQPEINGKEPAIHRIPPSALVRMGILHEWHESL